MRVVLALLALLTAELITVGVPFIYKGAVDSLTSGEAIDIAEVVAIGAVTLTIAYGVARVMSVLFHELRDVIFAKVGQRALRTIALETFKHIHNLSLRYHITAQDGWTLQNSRKRCQGGGLAAPFRFIFNRTIAHTVVDGVYGFVDSFGILVLCHDSDSDFPLCGIYVQGNGMASANSQGNEQAGYRRQPESHR